MLELQKHHPDVYEAFQNGKKKQKQKKRISFLALDWIHKQENVKVKQSGGVLIF